MTPSEIEAMSNEELIFNYFYGGCNNASDHVLLAVEIQNRLRPSIPRPSIDDFVKEVERRAENNMMKTGKLEGAHYAAMKQYQAELTAFGLHGEEGVCD